MNAVLISIIEVLAVGFTVWALFHEDRLVSFEKKVSALIKRKKLKVIKGGKYVGKNCA